jgi:hypothetical protein
MRESTLNKIGAFSLNPRRKLMLGQKANYLDFRAIMDEGRVLLLDLDRSDGETNRLIGSLVVTGLEMAMRRRQNRKLWNLTIDEFARADQRHLWDWHSIPRSSASARQRGCKMPGVKRSSSAHSTPSTSQDAPWQSPGNS